MPVLDMLDLSDDPIVVVTPPPGGSPQRVAGYHAALEWLIARGTPFVLVTPGDGADTAESADDQKARAVWFKQHLLALVQACRGFVYVEPDASKRAVWEARAEAMAKAFPAPMAIVADRAAAQAAARTMFEQAAEAAAAR